MDAQIQLGSFKKLQKAVKRLQKKSMFAAFYKWKDGVDEEAAELERKFQQPHVRRRR